MLEPKRAADASTGPVDVATTERTSLSEVLWKRAAEVTGVLAALLLLAAVTSW